MQNGFSFPRAFRVFLQFLILSFAALLLGGSAHAQYRLQSQPPSRRSSWLFPRNFIRGYTEFAVAPPHNEPDLGRCGQTNTCSAFARYILGGYIEIQPFARTPLKHVYIFYEPRFFFGDNIPQVRYTASFNPLAMERTIGAAIELPKHLELRITNHGVTSFDPFDQILGPSDSGPNKEPLGIYNTIGVRWYFGGYGRQNSSW
ncbi:MAG TPA: hypothetical protein VGT03_12780 [Candidatus Acidoferrales bacterium]|nr:hypothetical protein [Candidatus Acidoferrales bacterium]